MNTNDRISMITESTLDSRMKRTMERLEERLNGGNRTVEVDIHEFLHILSRMIGLEQDRNRMQEMLYRQFRGYSDHFNMSVNQVPTFQTSNTSEPNDQG